MDFFRILLALILSFLALKYQFSSVQNFVEKIDYIYIGLSEQNLSSYYNFIQGNSLSSSLHAFFMNFDVCYFLSKILMSRLDKSKVKNEIMQRNNFASLYGGASIIEKNDGALNTKSILDDNNDKYMLNKCSTKNKYVVISLKEDININGFAIINTEFYSSNVKDIIVYGSNEYPIEMKEWVQLGEFRLENVYEWQSFTLKTMWARYIRIEFKNHYDDEYYCTITQIKIFGSPILADFKKDFVNQKRDKKKIDNSKFTATPASTNTTNQTIPQKFENNKPNHEQTKQDEKNKIFDPQWEMIKTLQILHQSRRQCKIFDWRNYQELYQCSEEEAKQQEIEFEQSQSIFTILTSSISDIRGFIEDQIKQNQSFNIQIENYKTKLTTCNIDKTQIKEMNRIQMDQIEDLRKIFYTAGIFIIIFCFSLLLLICYKRK